MTYTPKSFRLLHLAMSYFQSMQRRLSLSWERLNSILLPICYLLFQPFRLDSLSFQSSLFVVNDL